MSRVEGPEELAASHNARVAVGKIPGTGGDYHARPGGERGRRLEGKADPFGEFDRAELDGACASVLDLDKLVAVAIVEQVAEC